MMATCWLSQDVINREINYRMPEANKDYNTVTYIFDTFWKFSQFFLFFFLRNTENRMKPHVAIRIEKVDYHKPFRDKKYLMLNIINLQIKVLDGFHSKS